MALIRVSESFPQAVIGRRGARWRVSAGGEGAGEGAALGRAGSIRVRLDTGQGRWKGRGAGRGRCFAGAVVKGPRRTALLPGTSESARSHEPAGGGCQQAELVIECLPSLTVTFRV